MESSSIISTPQPIQTPQPDNNTVSYGNFFTRFAAYLLDFYLFYIPAIILAFTLPDTFKFFGIVINISYLIYLVICVKIYGQTLGKRLFGLKVVREDNLSIGWLKAVVREAIGKTISHIFLIGFLYALISKKIQAFHDVLAKTIVIQQTPLTSFQKKLRLFTIVVLPLLLTALVMGIAINRLRLDQYKVDLIDNMKQKVQIITVSEPLARLAGTDVITQYQNELKDLCKKQYFFKSDCKLEDLNTTNLQVLNKFLEKIITNLFQLQSKLQQQSQNDKLVTFISDDTLLTFKYPNFLQYSHASHAGRDSIYGYSFFPKGTKLDQTDGGHIGNDVIDVDEYKVEGELNPWHMNTNHIINLNGYKAILDTSDSSEIVVEVLSHASRNLTSIILNQNVLSSKDQILNSIQIHD